jgi:hypothetical protein
VAGGPSITVGNRIVPFDVPVNARDARATLQRVTRAIRAAHTIVFDETLASSPTNASTSRFEVSAPNRLSYVTKNGPAGIVIGTRRWDRTGPGARWMESSQTPLDVTQPYWTEPTNAYFVAPNVITFLDRKIPAWFRLTLAGDRPTRVEMTAAAHFMVDRYVGFDVPVDISPPPSR